MSSDLPPLPNSGLGKFRPPPFPCKPGGPVSDATHRLINGKPCCSACRGYIVVRDGEWVHDEL